MRDTTSPRLGLFAWLNAMRLQLPGTVGPVLGFSLVANILLLVSPLYMLQVYDRILTSGSKDTLIWLTLIATFLMMIYAAAEAGRRRLCALAAERVDTVLSECVMADFEKTPDAGARLSQNLRRVSRLRGFFANQSVMPFFDLPFAPIFLLAMFVIHPLIGALGLVGGAILLAVAIAAEFSNRETTDTAASVGGRANAFASGLARQRSVIVAMGLAAPALRKWRETKSEARALSLSATTREGAFSAISRSGRQTLQILILGAGGALAITQQVSPGAIVAGSIILSRALGPIDQIVGSWRGIAAARSAWADLQPVLDGEIETSAFTPLPRPDARLTLNRLSLAIPGADAPLIRPFAFEAQGGDFIAILGPNGSGKSTLLQTLAGAWAPAGGSVALGGRNLHDWAAADRGQYVGYLPQDIELLPGSVAENIARMGEADAPEIIAAAKRAGAHDMILALPQGYETEVGIPGIGGLSAGQRQLIGLARALFGYPVLLLLDEPTANLDPAAAHATILRLRQIASAGVIIGVSTHDLKLIQATKSVLVLQNGAVISADTENYLKASQPKPAQAPRLKAVGGVS